MKKEIPAQTIIVCDMCGEKVDEIYGYFGKDRDFCYPCKYKILQKVEASVELAIKCYACGGTGFDRDERFYNGIKIPCQNCQRKPDSIYI